MTARSRAILRQATGFLVLGVAGGLLCACSSGVDASAPPQAGSPACVKASTRWPATVGRGKRRSTTADVPAVAAWGDPPVVARCGLPALGPTTEDCLQVSGVDWVVRRLSDGAAFTTFGRDPAIEVLVPHTDAPEPLLLPAFAAAAKQLPTDGHHCS